jgi:hypothetical protein
VTMGGPRWRRFARIFTPQWPVAAQRRRLALRRSRRSQSAPDAGGQTVVQVRSPRRGCVRRRYGAAGHARAHGQARRHWPLLIVRLTGFVTWSMDHEGWQTGQWSYRSSLGPRVLQLGW